MAETNDLDRAVSTVCSKFKISRLNAFQMKAISEFVKGKSDIFVSLQTGCVDTGVDVESGALRLSYEFSTRVLWRCPCQRISEKYSWTTVRSTSGSDVFGSG